MLTNLSPNNTVMYFKDEKLRWRNLLKLTVLTHGRAGIQFHAANSSLPTCALYQHVLIFLLILCTFSNSGRMVVILGILSNDKDRSNMAFESLRQEEMSQMLIDL